jgi:F0F1-type ATP synthase delta subunit
MRVNDYSKAVIALIQEGMEPDSAFTKLKAMLTLRNHSRLYPKILKELTTLSMKVISKDHATITVARKPDVEILKQKIEVAMAALNAKTRDIRVDDTIIGGFILDAHEKRINQSHKKALLNLYRSLIKS